MVETFKNLHNTDIRKANSWLRYKTIPINANSLITDNIAWLFSQ